MKLNREIFGDIHRRKRLIEARLRGLHRQMEVYGFSDMIRFEKELQNQYKTVLK